VNNVVTRGDSSRCTEPCVGGPNAHQLPTFKLVSPEVQPLDERWYFMRIGDQCMIITDVMAVLNSDLTPTERIIAIAIASHVNKPGEIVWPSIERIAKLSGTHPSTAVKVVSSLASKGWIVSKRRFSKSNQYSFNAIISHGATPVMAQSDNCEKTPLSLSHGATPVMAYGAPSHGATPPSVNAVRESNYPEKYPVEESRGETNALPEESWYKSLRLIGCKVHKSSIDLWKSLVDLHGVTAVRDAAMSVAATKRFADEVAGVLAGSDAKPDLGKRMRKFITDAMPGHGVFVSGDELLDVLRKCGPDGINRLIGYAKDEGELNKELFSIRVNGTRSSYDKRAYDIQPIRRLKVPMTDQEIIGHLDWAEKTKSA